MVLITLLHGSVSVAIRLLRGIMSVYVVAKSEVAMAYIYVKCWLHVTGCLCSRLFVCLLALHLKVGRALFPSPSLDGSSSRCGAFGVHAPASCPN